MGLYLMQEAGFELPSSWVDASVNMLEYPRPWGTLRVGLSRIAHEGKALFVLTEERLVEQRRKFPGFELLERKECVASGLSCIEIITRHDEPVGRRYHRSLFFLLGSNLLVLLVAGAASHSDEVDAIFLRAVSTMVLQSR